MFDYKLYCKSEKYKVYQKAYRELHKRTYKEKRQLTYYKRQEYHKQRYIEKRDYYKQYRDNNKQYYRQYYKKYRLLNPEYFTPEANKERIQTRTTTLNKLDIKYNKPKTLDNNFEIPNKIIIKI